MSTRVFRLVTVSIAGPLVALVLSSVVIAMTTDRFLDVRNLENLSLQVSIVALIAIGSTLVILTGGIDLSPGSQVAVLTMLLATFVKFNGQPAAPAPNAFGKNPTRERRNLALPAIDADGKHDDEAEHDLLPGGRHIVQVQPILDNHDRERAKQS